MTAEAKIDTNVLVVLLLAVLVVRPVLELPAVATVIVVPATWLAMVMLAIHRSDKILPVVIRLAVVGFAFGTLLIGVGLAVLMSQFSTLGWAGSILSGTASLLAGGALIGLGAYVVYPSRRGILVPSLIGLGIASVMIGFDLLSSSDSGYFVSPSFWSKIRTFVITGTIGLGVYVAAYAVIEVAACRRFAHVSVAFTLIGVTLVVVPVGLRANHHLAFHGIHLLGQYLVMLAGLIMVGLAVTFQIGRTKGDGKVLSAMHTVLRLLAIATTLAMTVVSSKLPSNQWETVIYALVAVLAVTLLYSNSLIDSQDGMKDSGQGVGKNGRVGKEQGDLAS